jgi:small basic protein
MFMCLICLLHLQVMFNLQMDLSSYVSCFHLLELLLFVAVIIAYSIYLSYMLVLFGIKIFNIIKYVGSMSLIFLKLQHFR